MSGSGPNDRLREIQEIVQEALALDEPPDPDARLIEDLGAESLDIISLVFEFEERFDRPISDDEVEELTTVRKIAELVAAEEGSEADDD